MSDLVVRPISASQHLAYAATRPSVSFLQLPSWAAVKAEWEHESLGWYDGDRLVGAGLVLLRKVPGLPRYLAYLPEGPDLDWLGDDTSAGSTHSLPDRLTPMVEHLRARGAFAVKMGPAVPVRRWHSDSLKAAVADEAVTRLRDVPADWTDDRALALAGQLTRAGWTQQADTGAGFGDVQPRYVFQLPLAGRTLDDVFAGFNQLWRRNVRKADKAGVKVSLGTYDDLPAFHEVYVQTAHRDGFTPRGLAYFQRMWHAMTAEDPLRLKLFLARHEGRVHAATTLVTVGDHAWYSYGASTTEGRDLRPSNAVQWAMIQDAHASGCAVYDLRGISDTLNQADPLFGLIGFKLGTGGQAQEYVGEWDLILRPTLARAVTMYLRKR
ncbi:MAG: peptidoglycan bridge formation glycyltransferase FemA/FemB family protein [Candidatus Nanopelagicales bacterium]